MSVERNRVDGFRRLDQGLRDASDRHHWGHCRSTRQRGTVREDRRPDGIAREYLPHDQARPRSLVPDGLDLVAYLILQDHGQGLPTLYELKLQSEQMKQLEQAPNA